MKKILAVLLLVSVVSGLPAAQQTEPLVTASLVSPLMIYQGEGEKESYDLSSCHPELLDVVAFPFLVNDSGLHLMDLLSGSMVKVAGAIWDAAVLISSVDNLQVLDAEGLISITPVLPDGTKGQASALIEFDDVRLLYQGGGLTDSAAIDGRVNASAVWDGKPIVTLSVDADTTLTKKSSAALSISLDERTLSTYLSFIGMDRMEMRLRALEIMRQEMNGEALSVLFGIEEDDEIDDVIQILTERNMLDILDSVGFIAIASEDPRLSDTDPFTMCFVPELVIDGRTLEEVDLQSLVKDVIRLSSLTSGL